MNYKITLSYNGSAYHGWSKQPGLPTVEQTIIDIFKKLFDLSVRINASGRTDAGVHALNQVINVEHKSLNLTPEKLLQALNSQVPRDIFIKDVVSINSSFHARFSCKTKTYIYLINTNAQYDVINHQQIYQYNQPIDIPKLLKTSLVFIGEHDFLSFSTSALTNTIRTINKITITQTNAIVQINVTGNGFLRNMVRMLVGSLLAINEDKIDFQDIQHLFDKPAKGKSMYKAPPCGLYLSKVDYN